MQTERPGARTTLIFADRYPLITEGISLKLSADYAVVATANDGDVLLALVRSFAPDFVVADVDLPNRNALEIVREARRDSLRSRFILLSANASPFIAHLAIDAGASGFVVKHERTAELVKAIELARVGRTYVTSEVRDAMAGVRARSLTEKRRAIVRLLARGWTVKRIAAELGVSPRTIEHQKYTIMQTLHVHSVLELVIRAESLGLLY